MPEEITRQQIDQMISEYLEWADSHGVLLQEGDVVHHTQDQRLGPRTPVVTHHRLPERVLDEFIDFAKLKLKLDKITSPRAQAWIERWKVWRS